MNYRIERILLAKSDFLLGQVPNFYLKSQSNKEFKYPKDNHGTRLGFFKQSELLIEMLATKHAQFDCKRREKNKEHSWKGEGRS